jgi:hypothetical protein
MTSGFLSIPTGMANAVQQGFLKKAVEKALTGKTAYSAVATPEPVDVREGQTKTMTRLAELAPAYSPMSPPSTTNGTTSLDLGITADNFSNEQWTAAPNYWARTLDVNTVQEQAMIFKETLEVGGKQGRQARGSREIDARNAFFNSYMGGNSRVINTTTSPSTTQAQLDDVRGFEQILQNGVMTSVGANGATLAVSEYATVSGGVAQGLVVTAVQRDTINVSSAQAVGGVSGTITFQAATTPVVGDCIIAANAPLILRPKGKLGTHLLTGQDTPSMSLISRAVAYLRDQGAPGFEALDDDYLLISDNASVDELFLDPAFMVAGTGRMDSVEFRGSRIKRYAGCAFQTSNYAAVQAPGNGVGVTVRRMLIVAKEALVRSDFKGLEAWARGGAGMSLFIHNVMMVDGIAHIIRPSIDRAGQVASFTWNGIFGHTCPTDGGTTSNIIPTASSAYFKRAVIIEFAG